MLNKVINVIVIEIGVIYGLSHPSDLLIVSVHISLQISRIVSELYRETLYLEVYK